MLALVLLVNRAGSMVVVLFAPYLTRELAMTAAFAGGLVTLYGSLQLVVSPLAGRLCDCFGALRVVVVVLLAFVRSPAPSGGSSAAGPSHDEPVPSLRPLLA